MCGQYFPGSSCGRCEDTPMCTDVEVLSVNIEVSTTDDGIQNCIEGEALIKAELDDMCSDIIDTDIDIKCTVNGFTVPIVSNCVAAQQCVSNCNTASNWTQCVSNCCTNNNCSNTNICTIAGPIPNPPEVVVTAKGTLDCCYDNAECKDTDPPQSCTVSGAQGICKDGQQVCTGGEWDACIGSDPVIEICDNGLDDDCDGLTDSDDIDDCQCVDGQTKNCGYTTGVCEYGVSECKSGKWGACE